MNIKELKEELDIYISEGKYEIYLPFDKFSLLLKELDDNKVTDKLAYSPQHTDKVLRIYLKK